MAREKNLLRRLADAVDLPDEPLPGLPIVELAGDRRVLIEGHAGVLEYNTQCIRIRVRYGQVCVCGNGLQLARMTGEQLIISGCIEQISLARGKG